MNDSKRIPFDYEKWLSGQYRAITRHGEYVRKLIFDTKDMNFPLSGQFGVIDDCRDIERLLNAVKKRLTD